MLNGIYVLDYLVMLQAMKEEIALIPDEDERRKDAAKAALGLVYGLEEGGETSGN